VLSESVKTTITDDVLEVQIGSPYNKIFKSVDIETYENKATAESIVNLQRLTDNENQNKKVTTDCSLLPVMEGRSCKTTFEMIGNAQIFPMQYFYLNSIPLFNGLYQTLKVNHSITPNDMTTKAQGIRMRFAPGTSGGVQPITLESFQKDDVVVEELENSPLKSRPGEDVAPASTSADSDPVTSGDGGGRKAGCPEMNFKKNDTSKRVAVSKVYASAKKIFPELSKKALSGMLGHFRYEGQFNPTAFNSTGGGCGALGIAQWRGNRLTNLENLAKKEGTGIEDFETQLKFIKQEMTNSYAKVWALLKNTSLSLRQYTAIVHISFGLGNSDPNSYYASVVDEATYKKAYEKRGGKTPQTIPKRYMYAQEFYQL
jgi:hypothetical protein